MDISVRRDSWWNIWFRDGNVCRWFLCVRLFWCSGSCIGGFLHRSISLFHLRIRCRDGGSRVYWVPNRCPRYICPFTILFLLLSHCSTNGCSRHHHTSSGAIRALGTYPRQCVFSHIWKLLLYRSWTIWSRVLHSSRNEPTLHTWSTVSKFLPTSIFNLLHPDPVFAFFKETSNSFPSLLKGITPDHSRLPLGIFITSNWRRA
mmetsp:Transcript_2799/g.4039  ORF Transcript_2799/g.4039 Transcript_2799/m.4039 type:complete len:203 (-) Transcript_2799:1753-2361(-)